MEYTETFIPESEIPKNPFRVGQSYKPDFGFWIALRWLYSISADGGKIWQHVIFYVFFTLGLTPLALWADIMGIVSYGLLLLAKRILEGILVALLNVTQAVASRFLGTAALISAAVGTGLIIYLKWQTITDFIKGLF